MSVEGFVVPMNALRFFLKVQSWKCFCPGALYLLNASEDRMIGFRKISVNKVWSYWKKFTRCERREISNGFRLKLLHGAWPEPQRKHGRAWYWRATSSMKLNCVDVKSPTLSYIIRTFLNGITNLCLCFFYQLFTCGWNTEVKCFHCVIWFHLQDLNIDISSHTKTVSCELKSSAAKVLKIYKHTVRKLF